VTADSKPDGNISELFAVQSWMAKGTCYVEKAPLDLFILESQGLTSDAARKQYCNRCPCRRECFDYGMRSGSVGVWGGEFLELTNRTEVKLRPLVVLTDARPIENLVNPPPLRDYQDPFS